MQRWLLLCLVLTAVGCGNSYPAVRQEGSISTITFPMAFGDYSRVYNTTYHIVNRYAVVREASYKRGVIEAELNQDTQLFEKTRRTILARLFDAGEYWDVECRVLIEVEDSDVETLGKYQPKYKWRVVGYDQFLETRLNNEIKSALTGGAWDTKAPLKYRGVASRMKNRQSRPGIQFESTSPKKTHSKVSHKLQQVNNSGQSNTQPDLPQARTVANTQSQPITTQNSNFNAREYERLGVYQLQQGQYDKAAKTFRQVRAHDADSVSINFLLAHTHFTQGQFTQAARALKRGLKHSSDWDKANIDLRSFYLDARKYDAHQARLTKHLQQFPNDTDAHLVSGWVLFSSKNYKRAQQQFLTVKSRDPKNPVAEHYLRQAQIQQALNTGTMREF